MPTYSFLDIVGSIGGPTGVCPIGAGAGVAEEGITVESVEDKNVMTIGADGQGQHSLVASDARTVTVRLLKTSPINAILQQFYNAQSVSAALWGQNVINFADIVRGDVIALQQVAFKKQPTITYDKAGPMIEWTFDAITDNTILGP